jgi:hypothetical protein
MSGSKQFIPCYAHYSDFSALLVGFDHLYQQVAPRRYAHLQSGIDLTEVKQLMEKLSVACLPEQYYQLYAWKNGFESLAEGWTNEMREDSWYELIPLNDGDHFLSWESATDLIGMWERILAEAQQNRELCYWKKGFVPFLACQNFGLYVIDTVGYFGGRPFQIISFDYKSSNGYSITHENLNKWLETQLTLLNQGLFFHPFNPASEKNAIELTWTINRYYTANFNQCIPLTLT